MNALFNWFSGEPKYICFEDVLTAIKNPTEYIIINTLPSNEQYGLIKGTCPISSEEETINKIVAKYNNIDYKIIVYGKNACDETVENKRKQLIALGFADIFIYKGGLFEWYLLQDIYGISNFPTEGIIHDILIYKGKQIFR